MKLIFLLMLLPTAIMSQNHWVVRSNNLTESETNVTKYELLNECNLNLEKAVFNDKNKIATFSENKTVEIGDIYEKHFNLEISIRDSTEYTILADKYRKTKNTFYALSVVTACVGIGFAISASDLYTQEYRFATDDATSIHTKIETQDIVWKISYGMSAILFTSALIFRNKEKKMYRKAQACIIPYNNGLGAVLTFTF